MVSAIPLLSLFPGGREKAVVFSFDDGGEGDRKLVEMFDRHGLGATFHLSSGLLGRRGHVQADEVQELYLNHEVAAHTMNHPNLMHVPEVFHGLEIMRDRARLEELTGGLVRGFAFPYGASDGELRARLPKLGMAYARTIEVSGHCYLPRDVYAWHPTCHAGAPLAEHLDGLLGQRPEGKWPLLLTAWGHATDFDAADLRRLDFSLGRIAEACETVWCATAVEVADYLAAQSTLRWGVDANIVQNASTLDVWVSLEGLPVCIPAGRTLQIGNGGVDPMPGPRRVTGGVLA